ncbi:DNA-binding MarR family transcriptional regulator [Nocardioides sp. BE266]|uniref:MarR family winged helix-turn-helix transcriptional regulator n=1 Tax=Nocardioides sp. BE266 TaxID=2817725 RepID=UPI002855BB76|nr:MarR family transcriptional regulator [Nocardioides sp. BE266]MDR7251291.1 DNA-binding MarR family transcriptional regulator [Nocardioides sp. BE266]
MSGEEQVRWLTPDERAAWLASAALMVKLPATLDARLQRAADLSLFEYMVLAVLSEQEGRTMQMSEIAAASSASLSRLSHAVKRLEKLGLIARSRCAGRGRRTNATLTEAGYAKVVDAAPAHVADVRDLLIDVITPEEREVLRRVGEKVVSRLDGGCPGG